MSHVVRQALYFPLPVAVEDALARHTERLGAILVKQGALHAANALNSMRFIGFCLRGLKVARALTLLPYGLLALKIIHISPLILVFY